jgi:hypothetical protein
MDLDGFGCAGLNVLDYLGRNRTWRDGLANGQLARLAVGTSAF